MKKVAVIALILLIGSAVFIGYRLTHKKVEVQEEQPAATTQQVNQTKGYTTEELKAIADSSFKNLYIGELFKIGYLYIEPFSSNRNTVNQETVIANYSNEIEFYPIEEDNIVYGALFDSKFNAYIPKTETESKYFNQPFSQPNQFGLKYKLDPNPQKSLMGIALFNHIIVKSDFTVKGQKRQSSEAELSEALKEIDKDKEVKPEDRTLQPITLDNTIAGAEQICLFTLGDIKMNMLLSKYNTHDFEYAADVYVIDFIKDGQIIQTYKKFNWDGPY